MPAEPFFSRFPCHARPTPAPEPLAKEGEESEHVQPLIDEGISRARDI